MFAPPGLGVFGIYGLHSEDVLQRDLLVAPVDLPSCSHQVLKVRLALGIDFFLVDEYPCGSVVECASLGANTRVVQLNSSQNE